MWGLRCVRSFGQSRSTRGLYSLQSSLSSSVDAAEVVKYAKQLEKYKDHFPNVANEAWNSLAQFCAITVDWNSKVNLISRKDIDGIVENHLIPSMSIALVHKFKVNECVIDIGCGGGFPGLPLSIIHPHTQFTLLDSSEKKMRIVRDVSERLLLKNVKVVTSRAEDFPEKFGTLLGRSVSAVPNFLSFSSHLQDRDSDSGLWYIKGGDFSGEMEEAKIQNYQLHPVKDLLPLDSAKFILHIPAIEINNFHKRQVTAAKHVKASKLKRG